MNVNIYKMHNDVRTPKYGTEFANCFDLEYFPVNDIVHGYNEHNAVVDRWVDKGSGELTINPGERLLVPTGLIFQFGEDNTYSLRLHSRSGLSLKRGLIPANGTGVVDVDYNLQVFALVANVSSVPQHISKHERICQAEIVKNEKVNFVEVMESPSKLGNRTGGFGSTGTI